MRLLTCLLLALSSPVFAAQTTPPPPDALTRARQLYNAEKFSEAVRDAEQARLIPALANAAAVVEARARLERYRLTPNPDDLSAAREALRVADLGRLTLRDQLEWSIGVGIAIFLDGEAAKRTDHYGAAADYFENALERAEGIEEPARDKIFEWWALALDRQAESGAESERRSTYLRIVERADRERTRSDLAASAMFWQVRASCGAGDLDRAWNGAQYTWIRARNMGARGVRLRADLNELVTKILLPARAKAMAASADQPTALADLVTLWEEIKKQWQ